MILGDIRDYLKQRQTVSLQDVATHFDLSDESASLAMDYWLKKGKVRVLAATCSSSCGSHCGSAGGQYQWVGQNPVRWFNLDTIRRR